jgi:hypothetical protein
MDGNTNAYTAVEIHARSVGVMVLMLALVWPVLNQILLDVMWSVPFLMPMMMTLKRWLIPDIVRHRIPAAQVRASSLGDASRIPWLVRALGDLAIILIDSWQWIPL